MIKIILILIIILLILFIILNKFTKISQEIYKNKKNLENFENNNKDKILSKSEIEKKQSEVTQLIQKNDIQNIQKKYNRFNKQKEKMFKIKKIKKKNNLFELSVKNNDSFDDCSKNYLKINNTPISPDDIENIRLLDLYQKKKLINEIPALQSGIFENFENQINFWKPYKINLDHSTKGFLNSPYKANTINKIETFEIIGDKIRCKSNKNYESPYGKGWIKGNTKYKEKFGKWCPVGGLNNQICKNVGIDDVCESNRFFDTKRECEISVYNN